MSDADMSVWCLAAADAIEPILKMCERAVAARSHVDVPFRRECPGGVRGIVAIKRQARAIDLQRTAIAAELETAVVDLAHIGAQVSRQEILRKLQGRVDGVGSFPRLEVVVTSGRGGRERCLDIHVPMNDVDPVSHEIRDAAAAIVPEVAPLIEALWLE